MCIRDSSWATAYYANTVASFIMNSHPKIKAVFESWKLQGGTKETFLSNLQKNQEVKNIILSESQERPLSLKLSVLLFCLLKTVFTHLAVS